MLLENKKHIHFIGIGGSGMFPLAQILHGKGYYLTGSDNNETDTLQMVREMGIPVTLGQKAENIEGADLIVHTACHYGRQSRTDRRPGKRRAHY